MSYTPEYIRVNWQNEPNLSTPLNALNLNKMDYTVKKHDDTFANWDTTKANQSDLLLSVKGITYNTQTGVFVFTWQNGTTLQVDLNVEKIPVSFSMDENGVITMTTSDGTQYTADIKSLITNYSFEDSAQIDFIVTDLSQWGSKSVGPITTATDYTFSNLSDLPVPTSLRFYIPTDEALVPYSNLCITNIRIDYQTDIGGGTYQTSGSGIITDKMVDLSNMTDILSINSIIVTCARINESSSGIGVLRLIANYPESQQTTKKVSALIKSGSITGDKLEPNFLANCQAAQTAAEQAESDAEAWAKGTRNGVPVESTDPAYENNSKYYSEQSVHTTFSSLNDVNFNNLQNGQVPVYNSTTQKWENGAGGGGGGTSAEDVSYDNTTSGLTATTAQDAIDETVEDIENKHTVTSFEVTTANWTQDITSQSGTTLYKKQLTLNHIYVDSPSVEIGAASGSVLPTTAQQEAYDLVLYATSDDTVPCLYLYASDIPQTAFYINVEGAD